MKKLRSSLLVILLLTFLSIDLSAQTAMRIHCKNGTTVEVNVEDVDSVTFVQNAEGTDPAKEAELTGSWFWGDTNLGYYEVLTLNSDLTFTGYDYFFAYGFDTMTWGWYGQMGTILTLWSNGYGYQRRYNWYIMALTDNALTVMTSTGPFTYYRIQPETIRLNVNGSLTCDDGDAFVFADGVTAKIDGKRLVALKAGETYVEKLIGATNKIVSYKVVIN